MAGVSATPRMIAALAALSLSLSCDGAPSRAGNASPATITATASAPVAAPVAAPGAPVALEPARGSEIGLVAEAFLSPHQEPGEEEDTPKGTPATFRSTTPSKSRAQREADGHRGHGVIRFSRDFSRAFVDVKLEGVAPETINMFHIHCGKPGILGPILVDFALTTDIQENLKDDGVMTVELTNEHLVKTSSHGHGLVAAFTAGCVILSPSLAGLKPTKVSTIAGMARLAEDRELYFNLHTTGQTFYGDVRGQIYPRD